MRLIAVLAMLSLAACAPRVDPKADAYAALRGRSDLVRICQRDWRVYRERTTGRLWAEDAFQGVDWIAQDVKPVDTCSGGDQ